MTRNLMCLIALLFIISIAKSQELNCNVQVEYSKTQSADPKIFENLKAAITEFMNNRKWTNDVYNVHEKIECSILINIDVEYSANLFGGQFIIQSERPVFNSNYSTVLFSFKDDKLKFEYNEFDNLNFSDNSYISNLTSFLAYYAYIIIGFDYESFSVEGGTPYFLKAQDVINAIPIGQKAKYEGWDAFSSPRNRSEFLTDILNPRFKAFRDAIYNFHFTGLDNMYNDTEKSKKAITASLDLIKKISDDEPSSVLLKVFFLAKSDELISIYSNSPTSERNKIIELLSDVDPLNIVKYKNIGK